MLRIFAAIVVTFFLVLWSSGNDINSLKQGMLHMADRNAQMSGAAKASGDWGQ